MFDIMSRGGITMWPLLFCSLTALAIIIERLWYFRSIQETSGDRTRYAELVTDAVYGKVVTNAYVALKEKRGPGALLARKFLAFVDEQQAAVTRETAQEYLEHEGRGIADMLESRLPVLDVIGIISPMLGLLGTVFGIMKAFNVLSVTTNVANPQLVSAGIAEALITTAAGLIVAIPCIVASAYFSRRVEKTLQDLDHFGDELLQILD